MSEETFLLKTSTEGIPVTLVRGTGKGAAVVIMPSAFGVNDSLRAQMQELAQGAYMVATFDPFFREDPGVCPNTDMARVMQRVKNINVERCANDLQALFAWVRSQGAEALVMIGICFGGPYALRAAAAKLVDAVTIWHGTRMENHLAYAASITCPVRMHFGSLDPITPPAVIESIQHAFAHHTRADIVVHEGATHGFTDRGSPAFVHAYERACVNTGRALVASATPS